MRNTNRILASLALALLFCVSSANAQKILPAYKASTVRAYGSSFDDGVYTQMDADSFAWVHPAGTLDAAWQSGNTFTMTFGATTDFITANSGEIGTKAPISVGSGGVFALHSQLGITGDYGGDGATFNYDTTTDNRWESSAPISAARFDLGTGYFDDSGDAIILNLESAPRATFDAAGFAFTVQTTIDGITIKDVSSETYMIDFAVAGESEGYMAIRVADAEPFTFTNAILVDGTVSSSAVFLGDSGLVWNNDANTRIAPNASEGLDIPGTLNVDNLLRISGNMATDGLSIDGSILLDGTRALKNVTSGTFSTSVSAGSTITAGTGLTVTSGNATVSNGIVSAVKSQNSAAGFSATNSNAGTAASAAVTLSNGTDEVAALYVAGTGHSTYPRDLVVGAPASQQMVALIGTSEAWTATSSANMLVENALTANDAAGASGDFTVKAQTSGNAFFVDVSGALSSFIGQLTVNSGAIAAGDLIVNKQTSGELARFDVSASTIALGGVTTTTHNGVAKVFAAGSMVNGTQYSAATFGESYWTAPDGDEYSLLIPVDVKVGEVISSISATARSVNFAGSDEIGMSAQLRKVTLSTGAATGVGSGASATFDANEVLTVSEGSLGETVADGFTYYIEIYIDATSSSAMDLQVYSATATFTSGVL